MSALARFKVIDLTRVRAGPTCVRQFADFGAQVVKVEAPGAADAEMGGPRHGFDFQNLHRNKRCITLDLKAPRGREALLRLAAQADVVVENFRPDVKDRLRIGYADMRAVNTRIVYASISGFGEDGPYRMRPGFDQIAQGMGGLMSVTGEPGRGPMRAGIPVADLTAGLFAAQGIMAALLEREVSGEGQWVRVSLLASQIAMMDFQAARYLMDGEVPKQAGNDHPTSIPTGVFATADGHVNIAAAGQVIWKRMCAALGLEALADDPAVRERGGAVRQPGGAERGDRGGDNHPELGRMGGGARGGGGCRAGRSIRWIRCSRTRRCSIWRMAPRVVHPVRGEYAVVGQAVGLSRTPAEIRTATAEAGQHTDEVLAEIGYSEAELASLRAEGVI